jgi:hypothetical protein
MANGSIGATAHWLPWTGMAWPCGSISLRTQATRHSSTELPAERPVSAGSLITN